MDLTKILSVSGKPGLHKHIAQSKNGVIIESLIDGSRSNAFASQQVSSLQDIAIFTYGEDKPLTEVFQDIYKKEDGKQSISHKSSANELKAFFEEILPDYDKERVYISNIKRIIEWYNILIENNLVDLEVPEEEKEEESKTESSEEDSKQEPEKEDKDTEK
ncbi:MAG: DUF5606 domain-containing protein [Bacteroidota bacterium]|nr:DUF5606 domain-containing protein [Bacteroidota bacterium]